MNDKKKLRIIYFGTPQFAIPALRALHNNDAFDVIAVVTQQDKKVGRKREILPPPVKNFAQEHNIPIFQPNKLRKNQEFKDIIKKLAPDIIVVAAYGKIIPPYLLKIPQFGCINIHGSLLPLYRGASPIQEAIKNGDTVTGVTIMLMDEHMDTGDILSTSPISIDLHDTAEDLFVKLAEIGAKSLLKTLLDYTNGKIQPRSQKHENATYTSMINKSDGKINWSEQTAQQIYNLYRAYYPWPGIFTFTYNTHKRVKLLKIELVLQENFTEFDSGIPGDIKVINNEVFVQCADDTFIKLLELQVEGKKRNSALSVINNLKYKKFK